MKQELISFLADRSQLWAMDEDVLADYRRKALFYAGPAIEARAPGGSMQSSGSVAVINISGPINYRPTIFTALFGGAAITELQGYFAQAIADDSVKAVVLAFDTLGGTVTGLAEFHEQIMSGRGAKPVIAQIVPIAASAGYWLASAASKIYSMPSGNVGSIGVITQHADLSGALEKEGIKITTISAGKFKGLGSSTAPLSEDDRARIQARVDAMYAQFVGDVAKGRGVSASDVRGGFGEGDIVDGAKAAKKLGMIDGESTLDETLGRLVGRKASVGVRAETIGVDLAAEADQTAMVQIDKDENFAARLQKYTDETRP